MPFLAPNPAHRELDGGRLSQLLEPVVYLDSVGEIPLAVRLRPYPMLVCPVVSV